MYIIILKNKKLAKIIARNCFYLCENVWFGRLTVREAEEIKNKAIPYGIDNIKIFKVSKEIIEITDKNKNFLKNTIDFLSE